ncbi:histidine--tRNA ligase [Vulcanibacillus modesticaldus]|uniref:Histidine--tRNA ligase n=1 Tax=Vulcanibacillus modesticaldus TaxID=337097 RepID=A0A1D2YTB9_9BACI|nr:histidine--tRNA ligase [Vulcanibacillus modesticaldus]OEF98927.1 histidine--tRNA ligase [Vulcanibacillus modesticaldus]
MKFRIPRGTADVLPKESRIWDFIEQTAKNVFKRYNYKEIRTPIFEHTELFQRGVGETTDIVEKEMYTFKDKGDRSLTLRPEGTASVVRSFVENKLYADPDPVKLYYIGPMFRYERPQSGRMRQFTQIGVEALGSNDPRIDAEVISMALRQFEEMGLDNLRLEINSVGCSSCRPVHREKLVTYLHDVKEQLCKDCQSRLERNPLRILDCKNETCKSLTKEAPTIEQHLCDDCRTHYEDLKGHLDSMGISYIENPRLVRGLDYYTQTAFEIMAEGIGAIGTICGGGRYNGLVGEIGGNDVPGIGYAFSIERIVLALKAKGIDLGLEQGLDVYLIALGQEAKTVATKILDNLRKNKLSADMDYLDRKMKAQMKAADRSDAQYVIIIGEDEIAKQKVILRNMETGDQKEVSFDDLIETISSQIIKR